MRRLKLRRLYDSINGLFHYLQLVSFGNSLFLLNVRRSSEVNMVICPICVNEISMWAQAGGKVVKINGILYHLTCVSESKVKEIAEGKWQPIKSP